MPPPVIETSNQYIRYSPTSGYGNGGYSNGGYGHSGYGYNQSGCGYGGYNGSGYNGYGYGNVAISEKAKALEQEKKEWQLYWTQKEEQCQLEQKEFKEQGWKWTGELWQRAAQLNAREEEIVKHERELAKREDDVRKQEAFLEEEKAKVLAQYKRVKKLERQGKRREERIEQAKRRLQQQANEHFSVVYTTLQLGIRSLSPPSTRSRDLIPLVSVSTLELDLSTYQPVPVVASLPSSHPIPSARIPFRTAIRSSNNSSSLLEFGKVKAMRSFDSPTPSVTILSKRHSACACTPTDKDDKATSISTVEAVNLVSTERDPFRGKTSVIDSNASLINVNGKKLNGKHYADDEDTPTFVCLCTTLFPSGDGTTSLPRVDKHNPHVDWGPLF